MTGSSRQPAALSGDAGRFGRYLAKSGRDYVLVAQPDEQRAQLRFIGHFDGRPVVWNCEFVTLLAASADRKSAPDTPPVLRNFIEVGPVSRCGRLLRVGLSLRLIDRPAIEKMLIMIRNYKHLSLGRHEYGEPADALNRAP